MDGPRRRLIGETLPDDEAALGVGLGGVCVFAGRLPPPVPRFPSPLMLPFLTSAAPPSFAGGPGGLIDRNSNLWLDLEIRRRERGRGECQGGETRRD